MTIKVTACVCTYDRYDLLPSAIESLTRQTSSHEKFEIVIVDNSPDLPKSERHSLPFQNIPNLVWLHSPVSGLSNARNVGLKHSSGDVIAFMDDDAMASPAWIESIIEAFDTFGETVVGVGGPVEPIWSLPRPEWLHDDLLGFVSVVDWGGLVPRKLGEKEWVAGTNIAFRVPPLRAIGGFSTALGRNKGGQALLSNEEIDVAEKLKFDGGSIVYAPRMTVRHLVEPKRLTQEWFRRRVAWQANSDYLKDPSTSFSKAATYWGGVEDYFIRIPPAHRNPRGFFVDQEDPELFKFQLSAIYNFTICVLAGFHGISVEG